MGAWNEWMDERAEAPLDRLLARLHAKWEETQEWLGDLCTDDDHSTDAIKKSDHKQEDSATPEVPTNQEVVSVSGYEELGQSPSEPPFSPPLGPGASPLMVPPTISLPGKACTVPVHVEVIDVDAPAEMKHDSSLRHHDVGDDGKCKPTPFMQLHHDSGPSLVAMEQECHPQLQKGENVEVWSRSNQSWFEGVVLEFLAAEKEDGGCKVPVGSYKVQYSGNVVKWVSPEEVQELLRPGSKTSGI